MLLQYNDNFQKNGAFTRSKILLALNIHQSNLIFNLTRIFKNLYKRIKQKGMTFEYNFYYSFSFSSSLFFLGGKRKGEKNKQSQKSCLSARSYKRLSKEIISNNYCYCKVGRAIIRFKAMVKIDYMFNI